MPNNSFSAAFCNRVYTVCNSIVPCAFPWTYIMLDLSSQKWVWAWLSRRKYCIAYNTPRKNNSCQFLPHRKNNQRKKVSSIWKPNNFYRQYDLFLSTNIKPDFVIHLNTIFTKYVTDIPLHERLWQFVLSDGWWWVCLLLLLDNSVLSVQR